jgi:hypothetical protein
MFIKFLFFYLQYGVRLVTWIGIVHFNLIIYFVILSTPDYERIQRMFLQIYLIAITAHLKTFQTTRMHTKQTHPIL